MIKRVSSGNHLEFQFYRFMKLSNDNSNIDEWKAALERAREATGRTELSQGGKAIWDKGFEAFKGRIPKDILANLPDAGEIMSKFKDLPGASYVQNLTKSRTALKGIPGIGTALSGIDIVAAGSDLAFSLLSIMQNVFANKNIPELDATSVPHPSYIKELAEKYKDNPKAMGDLGFVCCNAAKIINAATEMLQNTADITIDITSILPTGIFTLGASTGGSFALQAGQQKASEFLSKDYTEIQEDIIKKIKDKIVSLGGEVEEDQNEEGETETPPTPTE